VLAGYQLGESWWRVEAYAGLLQKIVIVAVALLVAWFVATRFRSRRRGEHRMS
jgi:membrane protein DedA with SNARE-associated domain